MSAPPRRSARIAKLNLVVNPLAPLPDELILEICDHILPEWNYEQFIYAIDAKAAQSTFAALARTCKYLYSFGMRYLYQTFQTRRVGHDNGFLRTIYNHPKLVSHVREVLVDRYNFCPSIPRTKLGMSSKKMAEEIRKLALPDTQKYLGILPTHPEEVELAVLIYNARDSLQRLERLQPSQCANNTHRLLWISALLHSAQQLSASPPIAGGFAKLQHLTLNMTGISLNQIAHVMVLPSLQSLGLQCLSNNDTDSLWPVAPRSSKVHVVHLIWSDVSAGLITRILQSCKAVTLFRYMEGESDVDPVHWHADVIEAVSIHRDSIREFRLNAEEPTFLPLRDRWPQVDSIAKMGNLRKLEIEHNVLMGKPQGIYELPYINQDVVWSGYTKSLHDLLPPNLVGLTLRYKRSAMIHGVDYNAQLRSLLSTNPTHQHQICRIRITYDHDDSAAMFPLKLASLEREFTNNDIEFEYSIKYTMSDIDEMNDIIYHLTDMGREGVMMVRRFFTDEDVLLGPRALEQTVSQRVREEEENQLEDIMLAGPGGFMYDSDGYTDEDEDFFYAHYDELLLDLLGH